MQPILFLTLLGGAAVHCAATSTRATASSAAVTAVDLSPITRVAELLKSIRFKTEAQGKIEEEKYEKFVCWGKSISNAKAASNTAAKSRIDVLTKYVADLEAGRIELTSERVDLEKEIQGLKGDLEQAAALREQENSDYVMAKREMDMAVSALTDSIRVLSEATKDHKEGSLIALRGRAAATAQHRASEAAVLSRAAEIGERFLSRSDARFLRRMLTGDVPKVDQKKLNRKATFKANYKARSGKIQDVLTKLLKTFESNLAEAKSKEEEAVNMYEKLSAAKKEELAAAEEALSKMEKEGGAKSLSKEEAEEEMDALKQQVKDDEKFIEDIQAALAEKKEEWKDRKALRAGEIAAMSKALAILQDDDNRDLFSRSFKSQGFFLQELQRKTFNSHKLNAAIDALRRAAESTGNRRLAALAASAAGNHFQEVLAAIDKMLAALAAEEQSDLEKKEQCEADRADDTRAAILASRTVDDATDTITSLEADIVELTEETDASEKRLKEAGEELEEATQMRKEEHEAWVVADKDDKDAVTVLQSAMLVIQQFYEDNGLALVQGRSRALMKQPFVAEAGKAPPPPPPTWELPYAGNTQQNMGVVAMMDMIKQDILKDIAKAFKEENEAVATYDKTKADLTEEQASLTEAISALKKTTAEKIENVETTKGSRRMTKGELDGVLEKIKDATPGCDFFMVNYPVRLQNRHTEVDGLQKAKDILKGAVYGEF